MCEHEYHPSIDSLSTRVRKKASTVVAAAVTAAESLLLNIYLPAASDGGSYNMFQMPPPTFHPWLRTEIPNTSHGSLRQA
jgi:hypothetical protein